MSRIEFSELSLCEVRRLNQFETADIIGIGLAVLHAWLRRELGSLRNHDGDGNGNATKQKV